MTYTKNLELNLSDINYTAIIHNTNDLTDYEIITQYCTMFNESIIYQILFLALMFAIVEIAYIIYRFIPRFKAVHDGLKQGLYIGMGAWLIITSLTLYAYLGYWNENTRQLLTYILYAIVFIIAITVYKRIWKYLKILKQ